MSKKLLILVLSADFAPYDKMIDTARQTWDSIDVENTETVFYCGESKKEDTDKIIYLPIQDHLFNMGKKTLMALEWALQNKEFDYIARPHSSIYVDKKLLKEYVDELPEENIFAGIETDSQNGFRYCWGGVGFLFSRDVIEKLVANKDSLLLNFMEDESVSLLAKDLEIPFSNYNKACSIDKQPDGWQLISYCGNSKTFIEFSEIKELGHVYYRVKQDGKRDVDEFIMRELFKYLQ